MKKQIIGILIGLLLFNGLAWSWSEKTHVIITQQAIIKAILREDPDLMHKLGMAFNEKHPLGLLGLGKSFDEWMRVGAEKEDAGSLWGKKRYNNHFHNPLMPFNSAGLLKGLFLSSIIWSQNPDDQETYVEYEGNNTWQRARELFFHGLIAARPELKSFQFALMFKALGHQCHLIQDMAVPDHVRDDMHVLNSVPWEWLAKINGSY